ncbi:Hyccin [Corchorus olitorius]|uniref:Hyccin n=1 Tax=Corchorus olitorius TaxID=93759 RepID=A0A1R3I3W5_9ROSI|nr:Hyccin [Corchorus olitorius]
MSGSSSSSSSDPDSPRATRVTAVKTSETPPSTSAPDFQPSPTFAPTSETPPPSSASSSSVARSSIQSLSSILSSVPSSLASSPNPSFSLLHDPIISSQISSLLRHPDSGSGDHNLCRWLYDTFHSTDPQLQLVVLRFLPIIAGVYLTRVSRRKSLAGFEAILLALYAHETTARRGQPVTVHVPDLSHSSIYHEAKPSTKTNATELNLAVISSSLEPHGTMRSTKRARIVGVALELYYSKISQLPVTSKIEFCEFCEIWAGQEISNHGDDNNGSNAANKEKRKGRIPLAWELLQPTLRIIGHCLLGPHRNKELYDAASSATKSLYARSLHDIDAKAILATSSLLRLQKMASDPKNNVGYTEIPKVNVITL